MTLIAYCPANIRACALHRIADVLDAIGIILFAAAAVIVAMSVPFYWMSGLTNAVSEIVRRQTRG